mgnify:CR=1 FL=1
MQGEFEGHIHYWICSYFTNRALAQHRRAFDQVATAILFKATVKDFE